MRRSCGCWNTSPTRKKRRLLGPQTVREITYHVLCGEQGHGLREALALHTHFGQISQVIQYIHANSHEALDVGTLAEARRT